MIPSPCINVCKMNGRTGLCLGCYRTLDEIAGWSAADDETRQNILAQVEKRRREQPAREGDPRYDCDDGGR